MKPRIAIATVAGTAIGLTAIVVAFRPTPRVIWNASKSVPIGLYAVGDANPLTISELVVVVPPEWLARFLADGNYLPRGVPLIKHVAALPSSIVCRSGPTLSIDGVVRAQARELDHAGRILPYWSGCRMIHTGEIFLLNGGEPASLDGRYFGPLPSSAVVGRAVPIWTEQRP